MARINLLPWRDELRKRRQRDFGIMMGGGALLAAVLVVVTHFYVEGLMDDQRARNNYLKQEIEIVDRQIREIKELERTKAGLLARMEVIQKLQSSRPLIVRLFDEIVRTIPDGVQLSKLVQRGNQVTLDGLAQSNARVSSYMRNVEASEWLADPGLKIIENRDKTNTGLSQFQMIVKQQTKSKEAAK